MLSSSELNAALDNEDLAEVDDATIQKLMTTAIKLYVDRVERGGPFPATSPAALTATQGMIACTALLRAVNVQLFELGLWQSWAH
jgi:hypothetical protein